MKKNKKNKKKMKTFKLLTFSLWAFMLSACLWLISSLFLRTYNNSLSSQLQAIENKVEEFEKANDALKIEINVLSTKDRVYNIAEENGLYYMGENVITITATNE